MQHKTREKKPHVVVIGNGSWATAQIKLLTNNLDNVAWYVRDKKMISYIRRYKRNPKYVPSVTFDVSRLHMSDDINALVKDANIVIVAVPSAFCKSVLDKITVDLRDKFVVSTVKGIIPIEDITPAEFIHERFNIPFSNIGIICGPCHAEEIGLDHLSYLTFASKHRKIAEIMSQLYAAPYVRSILSTDVFGVEYAAILKNIYAVGVGICLGLGYSDNFIAVLVANSHCEMKRFLDETYQSSRNTSHSAYLGDLLVTCYSEFSRNRTFGTLIGKGHSPKSAIDEMEMIAEGYFAAKGIHELNKRYNITMPIADTVYRILYSRASASNEIKKLIKDLR